MTPFVPPTASGLGDLLPPRVATAPDALAFACGDTSLTYSQLGEMVASLAGSLGSAGVAARDRIGLCVPAGLDFVRAFYALQHLGASPCAFDPATPAPALARRLERLRPSFVLASDRAAEALAGLGGTAQRVLRLAELDAQPPHLTVLHPRRAEPDEIAFLQPTSGTSGEPRIAMVSQHSALASLYGGALLLGIRPDDVMVGWVPPWHDLGLMRFVLGPVYFGVPCHLVPPAIRTLPQWLTTISRVRATITGATDLAYRLGARMVDPSSVDLSSLRMATNGGEPVRLSTVVEFERRFGLPGVVRPGYGLAEATLGVTCMRLGEPLRVDPQGNVSCGTALHSVEVRVDGPPGATAEILVRSPAIFRGYFEAPEATATSLREGWLHTGDVGRLDDDGHLYVLGRTRALLKRGGVPLAPRELEEAAESVPGVRSSAAVALPPTASSSTEVILVAVEQDPKDQQPPALISAAVATAVERAIGFAPDRVMVLAPGSIPRTYNGKTRYAALATEIIEGRLESVGAVRCGPPRPGS